MGWQAEDVVHLIALMVVVQAEIVFSGGSSQINPSGLFGKTTL